MKPTMIRQWLSDHGVTRWLCDRRVLAAVWIIIGIVSALSKMRIDRHNNFDIFRYVFYHTWEGTSLYAQSTDGGYWDINHYGPFFSIIIAPFAVMPVWLGLLLWNVMLAVFLFWAVSRYCSSHKMSGAGTAVMPFVIWFCAHELLTALFMQQFNVAIAAIILLSYYFVEKGRDEYATFFIVIGTLVKLYGIVGLAFFFFSRHKVKYIASLIVWSAILFCLPMIISSPDYQIGQYQEWIECLSGKNDENLLTTMQNVSLLGIVRKGLYMFSGGYVVNGVLEGGTSLDYSDLWLILPAMLLMAVGYFRIKQWNNTAFRQTILAAVMMFVCLFSTGTESSGYIIALIGCVIWYCAAPWQRTRWDITLMVFAFILTSLSPSDLFPRSVKDQLILPYALKALPVALIWAKLACEIILKDYHSYTYININPSSKQ